MDSERASADAELHLGAVRHHAGALLHSHQSVVRSGRPAMPPTRQCPTGNVLAAWWRAMWWRAGPQEMGATQTIPGSHKWPSTLGWESWEAQAELQEQLKSQVAYGAMKKGSVLIYVSNLLHGGGMNATADATRDACAIIYKLGWLRQEENHYLSCPPHIATQMPPKMQKLLGYPVRHGASLSTAQLPKEVAERAPVCWLRFGRCSLRAWATTPPATAPL